jgi:hypothetical protein
MTREEFMAKLEDLTDFAYARFGSYPEDSEERGIWARVFQHLEQAAREFPE